MVNPQWQTTREVEESGQPSFLVPAVRSRPLVVRTSDSIMFRRCRRKWYWASHNGLHLESTDDVISALWMGSGFHFALEDYHGYNYFGHPFEAFRAYVRCFRKTQIPDDWEELLELAEAMFGYYLESWLPRHDEFKTYWIDGQPQVEVEFEVPIPGIDSEDAVYRGTFDRILIDSHRRLWACDYKTAKRIDTSKLETDPQVSAYIWAARQLYGPNVEGMIYVQFLKERYGPPKLIQGGTELSQNKQQPTTYHMYKKALLDMFGKIPGRYVDFLNYLAAHEGPEGDAYIYRNIVRRSDTQIYLEGEKIAAQAQEMLSADLRLYPNPTNTCSFDCRFRDPCMAIDAGDDYEQLLGALFRKRVQHSWRQHLKLPEETGNLSDVPGIFTRTERLGGGTEEVGSEPLGPEINLEAWIADLEEAYG